MTGYFQISNKSDKYRILRALPDLHLIIFDFLGRLKGDSVIHGEVVGIHHLFLKASDSRLQCSKLIKER